MVIEQQFGDIAQSERIVAERAVQPRQRLEVPRLVHDERGKIELSSRLAGVHQLGQDAAGAGHRGLFTKVDRRQEPGERCALRSVQAKWRAEVEIA